MSGACLTAANAPRFEVQEVALYERPVQLRLPFRFGVITLTACPQAFARVRIALRDGGGQARRAEGASAELMVPKWFDKRPTLSHEQNIDHLRYVSHAAAARLRETKEPSTAFGFSVAMLEAVRAAARAADIQPLAAAFGPALLERALLDALCRAHGCSFFDAARANLFGFDARWLWETNAETDAETSAGTSAGTSAQVQAHRDRNRLTDFFASLQPRLQIAARHTVGLLDPIIDAEAIDPPQDGLPYSLEGAIRRYGHRAFKLKVSGHVEQDLARLRAIAAVLERAPPPWIATLDGNEQFEAAEPVVELLAKMQGETRLRQLFDRIAYVEQPITRGRAFDTSVAAIDALKPVIIDESDADESSFALARRAGYRGVSSKTCKGVYRALGNALRCRIWNEDAESGRAAPRYFMSGEDLTAQAGLAVQQDCALVALLGLAHVERNGHHYVNGMASATENEQQAFLTAHPSMYERSHSAVRLAIRDGDIDLSSLHVPGFATSAFPQWDALQPMLAPSPAISGSSYV